MKKLMTVFLLVSGLMFVVPAQAQLQWGIKGGWNLSKPSLSGEKIRASAKNNSGYFFGPMAELTIPLIGLGVDAAVMYSYRGAVDIYDETVDLNTIAIPINLNYTFGLSSMFGIYIAAGPQFDYNVGHKNVNGVKLKSSATSGNVGAGVKVLGHLQAGFNYNFSLAKTGRDVEDYAFDFKTNSWQISFAYLF